MEDHRLKELREQNKRLYCDSPPESTATPENVTPKPIDVTIRQNEIKKQFDFDSFGQIKKQFDNFGYDEPRGISGCARDNWFWIMVGIAGTLIFTVVSNNELGWIPKEAWAEYTAGGLFYFLYGIGHIAPVLMIFLGSWGLYSYCNTKACNRDHFNLGCVMVLLTAGILIAYFVFRFHQDGGFDDMWEFKDRMVGYALEDMK